MIEDIKKACEVLQAGGLILYPTDTIWGIGCDATNEEAVRKVYELKMCCSAFLSVGFVLNLCVNAFIS